MEPAKFHRLALLRRVAGEGALVLAASEVLSFVLNFVIFDPMANLFGADGIHWAFEILFWLATVASFTVVLAWILGWVVSDPLWARGLIATGWGIIVLWGWLLLNQLPDLWGTDRYLSETGALSPELVQLSWLALGTNLVVSLLTIGLLTFGGLRLLRADVPAAKAEPVRVAV